VREGETLVTRPADDALHCFSAGNQALFVSNQSLVFAHRTNSRLLEIENVDVLPSTGKCYR
jgi:hypothetical protein